MSPLSADQVSQRLRTAANRLRAWFQQRLDEQALDISRLYAAERDRFVYRIGQVYQSYLSADPTLMAARQGPAGALIDQAINETTTALGDELGRSAVSHLSDVLDATPAQVKKQYGAWSQLTFGDLPSTSRRALQELTTSVVGGGTFFDRVFHTTDGFKADITRTIRSSLINGDDFMTLRGRMMKAFGVDKLAEPKGVAYGSVRVYRNAAADAFSKLMKDVGEEAGGTMLWWATLDERTTPGCAARHGRPISEVGSPPRHYNCRCTQAVIERGTDRSEFTDEADAWLADQGYTRRQAARMEATRASAGGPTGGQWTSSGGAGGGSEPGHGDGGGGGGTSPRATAALPPHIAEPIEAFERAHARADRESARAVLPDGSVLIDKHGAAKYVQFSPEELARMRGQDVVFTHNHPRGFSFSHDDIALASELSLREIRAVTATGAYRMRPGPDGWLSRSGLAVEFKRVEEDVYAEFRAKIAREAMTIAQAEATHHDTVWRRLADAYPEHLLYSYEETHHAQDTGRRLEARRQLPIDLLDPTRVRYGTADGRADRSAPRGVPEDARRGRTADRVATAWAWGHHHLLPLYHIPRLTESDHGHQYGYRPVPWSSMPALAAGNLQVNDWSRPVAARRRGAPGDVLVRKRKNSRDLEVLAREGWVPVIPKSARAVWIPTPTGRALDGPDGAHWQERSIRAPLDVIEAWPGLREVVLPAADRWRVAVVGPEEAEAIALRESWDPAEHPRAPAGGPEGGEFTSGSGGSGDEPRGDAGRPSPGDVVYHATNVDAAMNIFDEGLRPRHLGQNTVYFSTTLDGARAWASNLALEAPYAIVEFRVPQGPDIAFDPSDREQFGWQGLDAWRIEGRVPGRDVLAIHTVNDGGSITTTKKKKESSADTCATAGFALVLFDHSGRTESRDFGALVREALAHAAIDDPHLVVYAGIYRPELAAVISCTTGQALCTREAFEGLAAPYQRAAVAVFEGEGLVWAIRPRGLPFWSLPGGHVDPGERPVDAAIREMAEETGVTIGRPRYLGRLYRSWSTTHVFVAERVGEPGYPETPDEVDGIQVVALDDLEPTERAFLVQHARGLRPAPAPTSSFEAAR